MAIVSAAEFADFVGKSAAWVSKQIAAGMPVARYGETGHSHEIDSKAACTWLLESGTPRLKQAQAEKAEAENLERLGKLIPIEDHWHMRGELVALFVAGLTAVPGRCAGEFAGITDPALMRARLQEEMDAVRNELANRAEIEADRLDGLVAAATARSEEPAATEADDAGSVG